MAIDSVSALSPIMAYTQRTQAIQPQQTAQGLQQTSAAGTAQTAQANTPGTAQANEPGTAQTNAPGTAQSTLANAPNTARTIAPGTAQTNAPGTAQTNAPGTAQTNAPGTAQTMQASNLGGPETMGNWNWAVAQPGVNATPSETEGSIRSASTQIAQAYGSGSTSPADIRNASQAYRNEASARDQAAQQQQGGGTRTMDIFA